MNRNQAKKWHNREFGCCVKGRSSSYNEVPPCIVSYHDKNDDKVYIGTVIDSDDNYYFVIPDYDSTSELEWLKKECTILR